MGLWFSCLIYITMVLQFFVSFKLNPYFENGCDFIARLYVHNRFLTMSIVPAHIPGFFLGGGPGGPPHLAKMLPIPPHPTLVPIFGPRLVPPPAEVCPRKFEKFTYIFASNLTTFKLRSTLKSCISCLKYKRWPNLALHGQFWLQLDFFRQVPPPPSDFVPIGPRRGPKILSPPNKNLEKKPFLQIEISKHVSILPHIKSPVMSCPLSKWD